MNLRPWYPLVIGMYLGTSITILDLLILELCCGHKE
jgi:hypothetical protein